MNTAFSNPATNAATRFGFPLYSAIAGSINLGMVGRVTPCAPPPANQRVRVRHDGGQRTARPTSLRKEFRAWRASLPTALERDTLLMPDAIAESVVQEAERFLKADLPANFAERLAAKAHHLYPRHRHFKKMLNRPGNSGRNNLYMYLRHWTAAWLKRERYALYKKLPWSFGNGQRLPVIPPHAKKLVTEDCIRPAEITR
jgi:hypothetical protein